MKRERMALLLIGSAKPRGSSTSEALGSYLLEKLDRRGWQTKTIYLHAALRTAKRSHNLMQIVDVSRLIILAAPLYVDSLPYLVTDALERIALYRQHVRSTWDGPQQFAAIINCGFPEALHNEVAIHICQQFAQEVGFTWAGGLSLGGGGFVHGVNPEELGPRAQGICAGLDMAAEALASEQQIPAEAVEQLAKPAIPAWLYTGFGNLGWRYTAWQQGTFRSLGQKPFVGPDS